MKEKNGKTMPAYRSKIKSERSDELYVKVLSCLTAAKRYRDPAYTAARIAEELGTDKRYISAAIANCTGSNFNTLVNGFRLRDVRKMFASPRFSHMTTEEIGLLAGFSSRQAFYIAFAKAYDKTPLQYRKSLKKHAEDADDTPLDTE